MGKKVAWLRPSSNKISLSIVTDPIPIGRYRITEMLKYFFKKLRRFIRRLYGKAPSISGYRGHPAVTRSVVEGLQKLNVSFNYNPNELIQLSQTVVVLAGVPVLKQMIELKQQGYIKYLIVGPNIVNDPSLFNGIIAAPEIDRYITHANVCNLIVRFLPTLLQRCIPWVAGVDCSYWQPDSQTQQHSKHILIYIKNVNDLTFNFHSIYNEMIKRGYEVSIIRYGSYHLTQYRALLQRSILMIGFSRDETQGIAWAEAWSCNVPTFIWKNNEPIYMGVKYFGSTAPYLSLNTGEFFSDENSFLEILKKWESEEFNFKPREWCLANMSDEACAKHLLKIAQCV